MPKLPPIGQAELEILSFIQDHHPVTVRQVADHLSSTRGLVRTTALNVMNRLVAKGFLARKKIDGVFHYAPKIQRPQLLRNLVRSFVKDTLGGSVSPFMMYLANDADLTQDQLDELKQLVSELEHKKEKP